MALADAILPGFLFGLANSAHCAGMCGVFAFQAGGGGGPGAWFRRLPLYFLGKTFTYVFLGTLAGAAGERVLHDATTAQAAVGAAVGLAFLWVAWRLLRPARAPGRLATAYARTVEPLFRGVKRANEVGGPFALGAVTGALPCGVVYLAVLQGVATGSALGGIVLMAAFGAGTVPVLLAAGLLGRGALARLGPKRLRVAGAAVLVATAAVMFWRAAPTLLGGGGAPACCSH